MNYLKIVNCPLNGCLKKDNKWKIDWASMWFDVVSTQRLSIQWYTEFVDWKTTWNFITLLPIWDETKFNEVKNEIIDNINNNAFENDSAEVVDQAVFDVDKAIIEDVKNQAKVNNV